MSSRKKMSVCKQDERRLINTVRRGEFAINRKGDINREGVRRHGKLFPCKSHRAEYRTEKGYLKVESIENGRRFRCFAHRLVYQYFNGNIPKGMTINHKNGIKHDNHPKNLEVATNKYQMQHAMFHLGTIGKLTYTNVRRIRQLAKNHSISELAAMFGVSANHLRRIVRMKHWVRAD